MFSLPDFSHFPLFLLFLLFCFHINLFHLLSTHSEFLFCYTFIHLALYRCLSRSFLPFAFFLHLRRWRWRWLHCDKAVCRNMACYCLSRAGISPTERCTQDCLAHANNQTSCMLELLYINTEKCEPHIPIRVSMVNCNDVTCCLENSLQLLNSTKTKVEQGGRIKKPGLMV